MVNGTWYTAHGGGGLNERLRGGCRRESQESYFTWRGSRLTAPRDDRSRTGEDPDAETGDWEVEFAADLEAESALRKAIV